jgi:hypothetical protein
MDAPKETFGADAEVARIKSDRDTERFAETIARAVSEGIEEAIQPFIDALSDRKPGMEFDKTIDGEVDIESLDKEIIGQSMKQDGSPLNQDSRNIEEIKDSVEAILSILQSQGQE